MTCSISSLDLTTEESAQLLEEGHLTFDSCVSAAELHRMRFEYEIVFEQFDASNAERFGGGEIERVAMLPAFTDYPALLGLIANSRVLAIAEAGLGTSDIEYTGSILRRTLFNSFIHAPDSKGYSWHPDCFLQGDRATASDDRIAIWIYLDDVMQEDGATQLLPGSTAQLRANLRAGRDERAGMEEAMRHADNDGEGVFATAPAGGGLAFKSYVMHRARPNRSGVVRRVATLDYRVRGTSFVPDGNFQSLSEEDKSRVREALPEAAHYLL